MSQHRDWTQVGILLVAMLALWFSVRHDATTARQSLEERIARIEQRMDDSDQDRKIMIDTLARIESSMTSRSR